VILHACGQESALQIRTAACVNKGTTRHWPRTADRATLQAAPGLGRALRTVSARVARTVMLSPADWDVDRLPAGTEGLVADHFRLRAAPSTMHAECLTAQCHTSPPRALLAGQPDGSPQHALARERHVLPSVERFGARLTQPGVARHRRGEWYTGACRDDVSE
jgi:hypothetical protein